MCLVAGSDFLRRGGEEGDGFDFSCRIIPIRVVNTWPTAPCWGRLGTENIASHSSTEPFVGPCLGSVLRAVIADVILLRPSRFQSGCLVHPFSLSQRCRMSLRTDARSVLCIAMLAVARLSVHY
ncbi:unnamed protein product [Toxocara canis]|uniref:Uncharacterized protein n=1 Tax=Toxocara canis TaxID=6265 RepID=A0A183U527_TOXCA|nr:unnamed protein product [Toxocara canis]